MGGKKELGHSVASLKQIDWTATVLCVFIRLEITVHIEVEVVEAFLQVFSRI